MTNSINVAILGASGYTGAELVRLLLNHPYVNITCLSGDSQAGKKMSEVYPHLTHVDLPVLVKPADIDYSDIQLVFACLPHGTTQPIIAAIPEHVRIVDLSADFRIKDAQLYEKTYGQPHQAMHLQEKAVYGLCEHARTDIAKARLVANPGCYPTSASMPLIPLLKEKLIDPSRITIDAKSAVSGAGRGAKQATLFTEVNEGIHAYGIATHRHTPEIEQTLSEAFNANVAVSFTPHLMPMNRGILSTIYVDLAKAVTAQTLKTTLQKTYKNAPFVQVLEGDAFPATHMVRGTNQCIINIFADRISGRAIIISVIDNLVKGASGQAIQNMNIMFDWPEDTALKLTAVFP